MKILMVCLGNICRSPVAEGILRHKALQNNLTVTIDSAGTSGYHSGSHPDIRSVENALSNGVDISKQVSRKFTEKDFEDFDKIYVMDSNNLKDVLSLAKTEKQKQKVELILNEVFPGENRSVPDPYFGNDGFENVFNLLDSACDRIIEHIKKEKI